MTQILCTELQSVVNEPSVSKPRDVFCIYCFIKISIEEITI